MCCVIATAPSVHAVCKSFIVLLLVFDFDAISCARVRTWKVVNSLPQQATEHDNSDGLHDLQGESVVAPASPSVKRAASIPNADLRRPGETAVMQPTTAEKSVLVSQHARGLEQPRNSTDLVFRQKRVVSSSNVDHLHEEPVPLLSRAFVELHMSSHLALISMGAGSFFNGFFFVGVIVCVCGLSASIHADSESEACEDEGGSEDHSGRRRPAKSVHFASEASNSPVLGPAPAVTSIKAGPALALTSIKAITQNVKETASHGSDIRGRDKYKLGDFTRGLAAAGREAQGKDADGKIQIGDVARGLFAKTSRRNKARSSSPTPQSASTASRTMSYSPR